MMNVFYENHLGEKINLCQWPLMLSEPEALVGAEWNVFAAENGTIYNFSKGGKETQTIVQIFADSEEEYKGVLNSVTQVTEIDVIEKKPGKLIIGDYYLLCYIVGWEYGEFEEDFYFVNKKVKVKAEKWIWCKNTTHEITYKTSVDTSGRGYPYGYEHDYAIGEGNISMISNSHFSSCDFIIKIIGYAFKPLIAINDHIYKVNEIIYDNEILTIDSKKRSITLTKNNKVQVSLFSKRERSSYIFEKIPAGDLKIYWNGSFDFELSLFEERSEPKWM